MEEIYPGIFMITEKRLLSLVTPPSNLYVITGHDGIVFDGGYGTKKALQSFVKEYRELESSYKLKGKIFNIDRVLLSHSHPDHFAGLNGISKKLGLKILLTRQMADHISSAENYTHQYREENEGSISSGNILKKVLVKLLYSLADAFFIKLYGISFLSEFEIVNYDKLIYINDEPWQIIHTPGHCEDHIALYNEKTGVLFSGDNVMRSITTWLGPPRSDIGSYVKSMKTLLELPKLEIILSAHGSPVTNPRERLKEIIKHREDRTQEVLDIIKTAGNSGISAKNIIKKMYTKEEMFKRLSSRGWVSLTLKQLIDNRQIDLIKSKKDPIYVSR